jgi:polyisoprenoid-binding protein YceI
MAKWKIDPDHSVAAFIVRHMMIADVRGQFNKISGTIYFDPAEAAKSSVEAVIAVGGIYTGITKRDDHLRSPEFLDVEKYPQIIFRSSKVESLNGNRLKVTGDLSIHGTTRTVVLDAEFSGIEKSPYGETTIGFSAATLINREDYGLLWNVALESGGVMVGKEVKIILDIEADLAVE